MPKLRLFPLHIVLFPGMPLGLHIFEERYKQLINECLRDGEPFGVVAIRRGSEVGDPAPDLFEVGTAAHILQVEPLDEGRMNIVGVGQARFRIEQLYTDRPYLYADVEYLHLRDQRDPALPALMNRVGLLLHRYLDVLRQADLVKGGGHELPGDPVSLAYLAAYVLQVPDEQKQVLVEENSLPALLHRLADMYRRELPLVQALLSPPPHEPMPFSEN